MSDVALRFGARDDGLNAQFNKTGKDLDALKSRVAGASVAISAGFGKIAAAAAAIGLGKLVGDAVEFADQLDAASTRTGVSVEGLQRLQFTANQTSGDLGSLTAAVGRMQVQLNAAGEGSGEAAKALARLHIPVNDFVALKPEEQFEKVAVAISRLVDPAERTAAAVGLFGRSGAELLPVLVSTGTELGKVTAQFEGIGGAVSADAIGKVDDLGDSFSALKLGVTSLSTELVSVFSPAITDAVLGVTHFVAGLRLLDGRGSNAIVNIDNRIRDLQSSLQDLEASQDRDGILGWLLPGNGELARASIRKVRNELDRLLETERQLAGLNANPLVKIAPPDASLVKLPGFDDPNAVSVNDTRLGALNADNNPVVIAKLEEKDLLLKINQETNDAMLQQETALSVARLNLNENTQTTLLGMAEAFSGQMIDMVAFRRDFEINAAMATAGLVGEALALVFAKNKTVSIALATISTLTGMAKALDLGWPAGPIAAAAIGAEGFARVAQIKSTNVGSSGGSFHGGGRGSLGSASSTPVSSPISPPPAQKERGIAQIHIHGDIMGEQSMRWLVDRLRDTIGDFDLVLDRPSR